MYFEINGLRLCSIEALLSSLRRQNLSLRPRGGMVEVGTRKKDRPKYNVNPQLRHKHFLFHISILGPKS